MMTATTSTVALFLARGHHHIPHHGGNGLGSTFLHSVVASFGWHTVSWLFHSSYGVLLVILGLVAVVLVGLRHFGTGRKHR